MHGIGRGCFGNRDVGKGVNFYSIEKEIALGKQLAQEVERQAKIEQARADVTLKALNHIDPERDIQFMLGPVDSLDHASRLPNFGSKMGIDATRKWPSEGFSRPWPDEITMDAKTKALVDKKWKDLGL